MKCKIPKIVLFILLSCTLALTSGIPLATAQDAQRFCVVDPIAPVVKEPGFKYKEATLQKGGYYLLEDAPDIQDVVVYGNHVAVRRVAGKYAKDWGELLGEDGDKLGYVPMKSLQPLPIYTKTETKYFWSKKTKPDLFLQPGKYSVSNKYGFSLLKGETASCVGEYGAPDGQRWLLLIFSTAEWTGYAGVGARYAWGRESDFLRLETYKPDFGTALPEDMPTRIRGNLDDNRSDYSFDPNQLARIAKYGFWIDPAPVLVGNIMADDMADSYTNTAEFVPQFITTDIYFHAWHLIFDRMLQKTEEKFFSKALERYLTAAVAELDARAKNISAAHPEAPRDAILTARDMLMLPLALLADPQSSPERRLSPAAVMEYRKILAAEERGNSAVTGAVTDYTLYRPRSHYTITPALSRYFRAMSFLGDATLRLGVRDERERRLNASAIALLCLVTDSRNVRPLYDEFAEPLRFMMGNADDNAVDDYGEVVRKLVAGDEESVTTPRVAEALHPVLVAASRPPRIADKPSSRPNMTEAERAEEAGGFRLIGKSFVYDAYVFAKLTSPAVGTNEEPRNLPAPEDVMTVLGSDAAYKLTNRYTEKYKNYGFNRRVLMDGTPAFLASAEADTAYSTWLRVLADSFADSGSPQFFYRDGGLWEWKKLLTASASWAELKHDTVLYAKQSGAEMGAGGEWIPGQYEPPRPRGYVDPEPQAFSRILRATKKMQRLLDLLKKSSLQYADGEYEHKLETFAKLCTTALDVAEKEARNQPLSVDDFADIEMLARAFTSDLLLPEGMFMADDDASAEQVKMALVTDVATDYLSGRVLHVATGTPRKIFVYVNDNSAGPRITVGYVYSYYEFVRAIGEGRTTDEEWKALVYDEKRQDELEALRPSWYKRLQF